MSVGTGKTSLSKDEILSRVPEAKILARYLGVTQVPTVISSPLRTDNHPSFGIYSPDGQKIRYRDFATGDSDSLFVLLEKLWNMSFIDVLGKIQKENFDNVVAAEVFITKENEHSTTYSGDTKLEVKIRDWCQYDADYWNQYGISVDILKQANAFPISYYIITKNGRKMVFPADKLAYAYVECKEGHLSIKVYQPYNKGRFKWINKHDRSVLGLWRAMPEKGEVLCICSSVKDALCLIANTGIPAICLQGESYGISETAQNILRQRFKHVCIMLDNDEPGKKDAKKLQHQTGFTNIELPPFPEGKDISDLYRALNNKEQFRSIIINLFKTTLYEEVHCN